MFQRIRDIRPACLFIAADGPRPNSTHDKIECERARQEVSEIDWPCEVHRLYRDKNLGCKIGVSSAISWFFNYVEEGIILEDDCLPDPTFFFFCANLLEHYRHEPRVAMISGSQFLSADNLNLQSASYYFSKYPNIWGWATWRRDWKDYDAEMPSWDGSSKSLSRIRNARVRRRFARRFDAVKRGTLDSWAYPFYYHCISNDKLCAIPAVNLIENIGFDQRATHTFEQTNELKAPRVQEMSMPIKHNEILKAEEKADIMMDTRVYRVPPNLLVSLLWSFHKRVARFFIWARTRFLPDKFTSNFKLQ